LTVFSSLPFPKVEGSYDNRRKGGSEASQTKSEAGHAIVANVPIAMHPSGEFTAKRRVSHLNVVTFSDQVGNFVAVTFAEDEMKPRIFFACRRLQL
jgi:hypothetical protein